MQMKINISFIFGPVIHYSKEMLKCKECFILSIE